MADKPTLTEQAPEKAGSNRDIPRGTIAEWTVTIILLLFGTTTLVQAFVIPTGSMEDTLLIGDHLLVDKLAYAPPGPLAGHLLPYEHVKHGDIIVFRYPVDIKQTFVKRVIGVPGDRIHLVNKQVYRNGVKLDEPYKFNKSDYIEPYRDNFPAAPPNSQVLDRGMAMLEHHVKRRGSRGPGGQLLRDGRQSRLVARQPVLGLRAA